MKGKVFNRLENSVANGEITHRDNFFFSKEVGCICVKICLHMGKCKNILGCRNILFSRKGFYSVIAYVHVVLNDRVKADTSIAPLHSKIGRQDTFVNVRITKSRYVHQPTNSHEVVYIFSSVVDYALFRRQFIFPFILRLCLVNTEHA